MQEPRESGPLVRRAAGILLHPTSLPAENGLGDLGSTAWRFAEFLAAAGMRIWQVLPLGPTLGDLSPYQNLSVHAGNPRLISLQRLREWGWLDTLPAPSGSEEAWRRNCLEAAWRGFQARADSAQWEALEAFRESHPWLGDFALFCAIRETQGLRAWTAWPALLRDRDPEALAQFAATHRDRVQRIEFEQYCFFRQWHELRAHVHGLGIRLFGDMPIFAAHDCAEVWANRRYFKLDACGRPRVVAGVPPDYFSRTGQRWGNPLYDWDALEAEGFQWWVERMRTQLELYDLVRIDHFRGFVAAWEIPAGERTAVHGTWVPGPGERLFRRLVQEFGPLPVVAEDLGTITDDVVALREALGFPGMKVLQFAFGGDAHNPYLPHNHEPGAVVYTGTHDNDTTLGWYRSLQPQVRDHLEAYAPSGEPMPWRLVRMALASVARLAVIPMQDVLALGSEARMNTPGRRGGNWRWQFSWEQVEEGLAERLRELNRLYGRVD
ncbi:MAG: 4-alpha-glucanotransferase [Gammaproteobacteria bacterium]|nr:MAG: 4-alpha-glucanotransferase [Gammaproteobacteria bacterium]